MEKTVGARDDQGSYRGGNVNGTLLGSQRGQDVAAGWEITRATDMAGVGGDQRHEQEENQ